MKLQLPNWRAYLSAKFFKKTIDRRKDFTQIIRHASKNYAFWDEFKHYPLPNGITHEEAWSYVKFTRFSQNENAPITAINGGQFTFSLTKTMYQELSYIDSHAGNILTVDWAPTMSQKNRLLLSGLTEEAIASSQIEGANTSRKVAKEMLLTNRKPRTKSEQMIINNFKVMQKLKEYKNLELSIDILIEMQKIITEGTVDNPQDSGRLRTDEDVVAVVQKITGEVVFAPPSRAIMEKELNKLIVYANSIESSDNFVHPVIKGSILHFWLAYLHPFVDGNGRTARSLFYWYMLKSNYWLFQYLTVSRVILKSKTSYDNSFIFSEKDDNDLTYFLIYKLRAIDNALDNFIAYYKKKIEQEEKIRKLSSSKLDLNERQINLLIYVIDHPNSELSISNHQIKHQIAYESSRRDFMSLVSRGYLTQATRGKKYIYIPNIQQIKRTIQTM